MPRMNEFEAQWSAMSVPERLKALESREIRPSLKEMSDKFEKRRRDGSLPKRDVVPSFVSAFVGMRNESKEGSEEERGIARACMKIVKKSARQQLSRKDFARFMEGIK